MYPLLDNTDRENMTRIWQKVMPADDFAGALQLVHQAIGSEFAELAWRIRASPPENKTRADRYLHETCSSARPLEQRTFVLEERDQRVDDQPHPGRVTVVGGITTNTSPHATTAGVSRTSVG